MKHLLTLAFLLVCGLLSAQAALASPDSLVSEAVESLLAEIPQGRPLALDVQGEPAVQGLVWELTQALLDRGDTVLVNTAPGALLVQVRHTSARETKGGNSILARTLRETTTHSFGLLVIDADDGEVLHTARFSHVTERPLKDELQTMRWYDPVVLSVALGGLIYLFYYGSE